MSYQLRVLADNPFSFWKLDGVGPVYENSAGSMRQADLIGSAIFHSALVSGSGNALVLSNTNRVEMDDPIFNKGYEARQWSLEAWVKPLAITGEVSVMSHNNEYDGITITPTHIIFSTKYLSTGSCAVHYRYNTKKAFHVVGVHTAAKNSLYVDGVLVGEQDITDEQSIDAYSTLTSDLIAGQSSTSSIIAVDAPAIYSGSLSYETITKHYNYGISTAKSESIAGFNYANFWDFSDEKRNIAVSAQWSTEDEWNTGILDDVYVSNNSITPFYTRTETEVVVDGLITYEYEDTSLPGTWQTSVELFQAPESDLADAQIRWQGEGSFTVEYSLDGLTWTAAGDTESLELTNTDSINIRVTFAGGIVDDQSYVSNIEVVVYVDKSFRGTLDNRQAAFSNTGVSSKEFYEPIEYADSNGFTILSGSINVTADSSFDGEEEEPEELFINAIDMWVKPVVGNIVSTSEADSISRSSNSIVFAGFSSVVVNGIPVDSGDNVFTSDMWYHIGAILETPSNPSLTIGAAGMSVSQFSAIYGDINEIGMQQIYNAYLGIAGVIVDDSSTVQISQPANPCNIYAHVWAISDAG